jgi:hypothetical protein
MGSESAILLNNESFNRSKSILKFADFEVEVLSKVLKLSEIVKNQGFQCEAYSTKSLEIFKNLEDSRKIQVRNYVENSLMVAQTASTWEPDLPREKDSNRATIEQALKLYGLEIRDDLWSVVDRDDIIEIYNQDQIQIFRTFNFFKITGYSLLDLLTIEWFLLWKRPSLVVAELTSLAKRVGDGLMSGLEHTGVSPHIVVEDYTSEADSKPRSAKAIFKYTCPVYKEGLPIRAGFIITSTGRLLQVGEENRGLSFI